MRICIVTTEYSGKSIYSGGIGTYQRFLALEFSRKGHDVHVLVINCANDADFVEDNIHYHTRLVKIPFGIARIDLISENFPLKSIFGFRRIHQELKKLCQEYAFDILQTTNYGASCYSFLAERKRPKIVTWVNTFEQEIAMSNYSKLRFKDKVSCWIEKKAILRSDYVVTTSDCHEQTIRRILRIQSPVKIIPLGIDIPAEESIKNAPRQKLTCLYVGRFENRKGTDVLLEAIPLVLKEFPEANFILAGKDFRDSYKSQFVKKYPAFRNSVQFKGEVTEDIKISLYKSCDFFVSPSRYESFGLTFVEAMSFGKAVVGTRVASIPEVIEDELTGLLAEPGNSQDLAKCLLRLFQDKQARNAMGQRARKAAQEKFSSKRMAENAISYYSEILNKPNQNDVVPDISVIIPTYNRLSLLPRAIESIKGQTNQNFEVIVVQNGPKNDTDLLVEDYRRKGMPIRFIYEPVANASRARNIGIKESKGRYIAFLEDDDVWYPMKLEKQLKVIQQSKRFGLVTCRSNEVTAEGTFRRLRPPSMIACSFKSLVEYEAMHVISSLSGILLRKEVFEKTGYFDESFHISGDVKFYLELMRHFECVSLEEVLFDYTLHEGNLSSHVERGWSEMIRILKGLALSPSCGVSSKMVGKAISRYALKFYARGSDALDEHKYKLAAGFFMKAVQADCLIGVRVPWSKSKNIFSNALKPFFAVLYSFCRGLGERKL